MPQADDPDLVNALRAGRPEAFAVLVKLHYQAVYRWAFRLTMDVHQAEDLTQETFSTAWQKVASFEGRASVRTWLHRIAYTRFLDCRRAARQASRPGQRLDDARESAPAPLDRLVVEDEVQRLTQALRRLDETDRCVLILHYLQDLSYREMADVLDEPSGTVKWRTSLALGRLRALLPEGAADHEAPRPR